MAATASGCRSFDVIFFGYGSSRRHANDGILHKASGQNCPSMHRAFKSLDSIAGVTAWIKATICPRNGRMPNGWPWGWPFFRINGLRQTNDAIDGRQCRLSEQLPRHALDRITSHGTWREALGCYHTQTGMWQIGLTCIQHEVCGTLHGSQTKKTDENSFPFLTIRRFRVQRSSERSPVTPSLKAARALTDLLAATCVQHSAATAGCHTGRLKPWVRCGVTTEGW
ncbi:hypothetical protein FQR65_LT20897 [Abscondita terminalis]|nr:hypothetical protein FQR65_LT20897 [Abscondita terminalis]